MPHRGLDSRFMATLARLPLGQSRPWIGYCVAVALSVGGFWLRDQIGDGLPPGFPYLTFFPAVIITAFFFGIGPGIVAAILSGLAAWYFFLPPFGSFALSFGAAIALGFYIFIVTVDIALVHWMQRANAVSREERRRSLALAENRELLFRELQHRVGNNLQMIASLISLQTRRLTDETARSALEEAARRVGTVGRIQRQLYDPRGTQLSLAAYIDQIGRDVIDASGREGVDYSFAASSDMVLPPEKAIPTAIVVAEAINNAIEHGFGTDGSGHVAVTVESVEGGMAVTVADDGKGLPSGFNLDTADSLGLKIARALAQSVGGDFAMTAAPQGRGTLARLQIAVSPALAG